MDGIVADQKIEHEAISASNARLKPKKSDRRGHAVSFCGQPHTLSIKICNKQLVEMELRLAFASKMTRPGLEPGISGSGGRRLIH